MAWHHWGAVDVMMCFFAYVSEQEVARMCRGFRQMGRHVQVVFKLRLMSGVKAAFVVALMSVGALLGCGQRGALFLPEAPQAASVQDDQDETERQEQRARAQGSSSQEPSAAPAQATKQ